MPRVPAARPDGAKIRQLIKDRGYVSIAEFASTRRRLKAKTVYNLIHGTQRGSIEYFEELAEALSDEAHPVEPEDLILDGDGAEALAS